MIWHIFIHKLVNLKKKKKTLTWQLNTVNRYQRVYVFQLMSFISRKHHNTLFKYFFVINYRFNRYCTVQFWSGRFWSLFSIVNVENMYWFES